MRGSSFPIPADFGLDEARAARDAALGRADALLRDEASTADQRAAAAAEAAWLERILRDLGGRAGASS